MQGRDSARTLWVPASSCSLGHDPRPPTPNQRKPLTWGQKPHCAGNPQMSSGTRTPPAPSESEHRSSGRSSTPQLTPHPRSGCASGSPLTQTAGTRSERAASALQKGRADGLKSPGNTHTQNKGDLLRAAGHTGQSLEPGPGFKFYCEKPLHRRVQTVPTEKGHVPDTARGLEILLDSQACPHPHGTF